MTTKHITDNLTRARPAFAEVVSLRAADQAGDGNTLFGHFSVFNTFYEINSVFEGHFLERIAPGAFKRTLEERASQIKALYDHGHDPQLGNKPLGPFNVLREDNVGGYYEIGLIDTDYNRDFIIPAASAGLLGASFRFSVANGGDEWNMKPKESASNPKGLPERTITDANVYELGPVTFPASGSATAALRSTSDDFYDRLLNDPLFLARFTERVGLGVVEKVITSLPPDGRNSNTPDETADGQPTGSLNPTIDGRLASALADIQRRKNQ